MRNKKAKEIRRAIKLGWQGTTETSYVAHPSNPRQVVLAPLCFRKLYKTVKKNMKRTTQGGL